ncbi:ATG8-interacting protein 1 isoform X2 [Ziziphus jujuba]|uniref:ATG8-interacting protein 1 isoform X2 n=1 Tax=Ziziphus jujuba TaxID=326968 RepID=A0A6P4ASE1_ZIZJJ|nr:ATG8-interacting protein 1 isoform X2 [Ziziphus jujuba]
MADNEEGEEKTSRGNDWRMADNEEGEENTPRGNEWEVVSLTASAYAAAPGPEQVELKNDSYVEEAETSHALFMSRHFVFPPSQHENLPLEPENIEIHNEEAGDNDVVTELGVEEGGRSSGKDGENLNLKGLTEPDEFPGIQFFEKASSLSLHGTEFEEGNTLERLNLVDKEQIMYDASKYSSFQNETALGDTTSYVEDMDISGPIESPEQGLDAGNITRLPQPSKHDNSDLPCGAWWKRRAASMYSHAKDANAVWSVFIAAAVMGLVILGQRWQQERWQALQLKWQLSLNEDYEAPQERSQEGCWARYLDLKM